MNCIVYRHTQCQKNNLNEFLINVSDYAIYWLMIDFCIVVDRHLVYSSKYNLLKSDSTFCRLIAKYV